jgi:hypothetical protein
MACAEETKTACRVFVGKPGGRNHLEDLDLDGGLKLKWNLNSMGGCELDLFISVFLNLFEPLARLGQ